MLRFLAHVPTVQWGGSRNPNGTEILVSLPISFLTVCIPVGVHGGYDTSVDVVLFSPTLSTLRITASAANRWVNWIAVGR